MRSAPAEKPERSPLRTALAVSSYAVVVAFLGYSLWKLDFAALGRIDLSFGVLAGAFVVGLVQRFSLPVVWLAMLRSLDQRVRGYPRYNLVYAKGWLSRYVPGKVGMVAVRVYLAETVGASRAAVAVSSIAELGTQMLVACTAGLVGVAFVPGDVPILDDLRPIAWIGGGLLALVLWPRFFNTATALGMKVLRRSSDLPRVGPRTLGWAAGGYGAVSLLTGAQMVLVAAAVDASAFEHPVFLWGALHLAGAVGMMMVFVPAGLGARDGALLALVALLLPPAPALAVVVLHRVVDVALDLSFYGLSATWARLSPSNEVDA